MSIGQLGPHGKTSQVLLNSSFLWLPCPCLFPMELSVSQQLCWPAS